LSTSVHKSVLVPYSADEMYALVADLESYPQFLPWCSDARILSQDADRVEAMIEMSKGGIRKSFTTRNRLQPGKMIEMRLREGPFRRLEGYWRFDPLGDDGSKVSLDLEFEFATRMLELVIGPVFNQIVESLVDAFHQRAVAVYGKR